ncbi:hypothetical protein CcaverHIS641_0204370 [Cutaneotrichosporon cavernicola]|nr:hypothetical protein CcaverHIS641_0204370 [Cutaneotrichosporon cavernicola]
MFPQRMPVGRPSADAPVSVVGSEFSDLYNRHLSTEGLPPPPGLGALAAYPISPLASLASLVSRPLPPLPDAPLPPIQNDSESEHTLTPDSPLGSPTPTPSPTPRPPLPNAPLNPLPLLRKSQRLFCGPNHANFAAPFLVPIDSTPSSRSSPSFSGHIAATTNHSSVTESDGRVAAWLGAARRASDDMHERAKPPIYAVLRDDDGSERTLGPWPLPPRRLPIPLPTLPPLIPTPPPPSPIRVYHYPAVAGWSAHHLPLAHSPFEDPILWKEERKGIFDAMWGVCVAALAYLLALIRRQEGGSASIHTEALPSHGTSAELIRRNVEF